MRSSRLSRLLMLLLAMAAGTTAAPASQQRPVETARETLQSNHAPTRYTLSPDRYDKAVRYSRAWYRLYFAGTAWTVASLLLLLRLRIAARYRDWAVRFSRRRFAQALVFSPLLVVTLAVLALPLDAAGHWLSLAYGQSIQPWSSWFLDWGKQLGLMALGASFLAWLLYAIIARAAARWWLYSWLALLPVIVFVVFLVPLVVDPLFFRFQPLDAGHPELARGIERVLDHAGVRVPREQLFEMNASEKTNALNAYMTGLGASKRVVVWDTTIRRLTIPETLAVFGHELGHYVLGHVPRGIVFASVLLLAALFLLDLLATRAISEWGVALGIRGLSDWASAPLLLLIVAILGFLTTPLVSTYSRAQEHDADVYALEVMHGVVPEEREAAARSFQVMGAMNLSDPHPGGFIRFWLYDHPPLDERIRFVWEYDPWGSGQPPRFVKR